MCAGPFGACLHGYPELWAEPTDTMRSQIIGIVNPERVERTGRYSDRLVRLHFPGSHEREGLPRLVDGETVVSGPCISDGDRPVPADRRIPTYQWLGARDLSDKTAIVRFARGVSRDPWKARRVRFVSMLRVPKLPDSRTATTHVDPIGGAM
jgi:hypothetical protein